MADSKKLLLHTCCAPCSPHVLAVLSETYDVTAYFHNPNIHPAEELELRVAEIERFSAQAGFALVVDGGGLDEWEGAIRGLEDEPERGARCDKCFAHRLGRAAMYAAGHGFDAFATTLTISPHKSAEQVNAAGRDAAGAAGVEFVEADFKKDDGFRKSAEMSRERNFYMQNYCGCRFSMRGKAGK